ncbi:MAG TPA: Na+/H+ antiporter subunit A [Propioniciclava sp.]|uniref:Na+/H+ antiporter subunit A n=1 Tax=Propioniciclava sp. TaxID=2038686 RepID=UPI002BF83256|nr:Na+/H+ antiporter subunit A [Propioniciclava sp.]HRL47764.1 Na+/H+ antiporter subunit A [Propioniciclava sp.]HRL79981.1 Na+/H+ antiporter subunit A [Propioniciclava sp.]
MLIGLIALHFLVGAMAAVWSRWLGRNAFLAVAIVPLLGFVLLLAESGPILSGAAYVETMPWIPALGVSLTFRVGLLQWLLGLLVTGIGVIVLVYCRWYFSRPPARTLGLLVAFAGAMLGLVASDDLVVLYVFWELTTVFSYLMIGHDSSRRANRAAATTALIVTTTGGLAMLVGIVTFGVLGGSFSLSAILATPPQGLAATAAALLMLAGALSKSALAPFHFWLPGAMAAPTPVSAYLHAATMVKAGVYLVAAMAPAFASVPLWRPVIAILGAATMILGGWRALRQDDLKLLLAYGTVSQLGFIMLLVGLGTQAAAQAGLAMLLAHALFKATLFLSVGVIDHSTGTRDITRLSGLASRMPVVAVIAGLAAASMAGLPPLFGFLAKEAALDALVRLTGAGGDGTGFLPAAAVLLVVAVVVGSMLTAAYSLRFWWGAFGSRRRVEPTPLKHTPAAGFLAGPALLGLACLAMGFLGAPLTDVLSSYVTSVHTGEHPHSLALWHGFTAPLGLSALALAGGAVLFWQRDGVARVQGTFPHMPAANDFYRTTMRLLDAVAVEVTARVQRGSLASSIGMILSVFIVLVGGTLVLMPVWPVVPVAYDNLAQVAVAVVTCAAAISLVTVRGRIRAILTVGVTGFGTALLFLLHGAPDLALTQVLIETASLLVFLMVMRTLPKYFTDRPLHSSRWWRMLLAIGVGVTVTASILVSAGSRVAEPASAGLETAAYEFGYGKNIVNVILVDTRAWDTLGEISVLVIAATGVASLIFLRSRVPGRRPTRATATNQGKGAWLRASQSLHPAARSLIFEVVTRLLFSVMILVSIYLLIAGHNLPGGGFAGGLVAGLALMVRYLAAGAKELDEAAPVDAGRVLGLGLFIGAGSSMLPWAFGGRIFQSYDVHVTIPALTAVETPWGAVNLFGDLHLVSSTVFDIGVYLVVLGMMLDLVRSLGAGIDQQAEEERTPMPRPESTTALPATARRPGGAR